ncbi:MAG TPA: hypothetical protein VGO93_25155 [Candidatus Xenobia bacterium]
MIGDIERLVERVLELVGGWMFGLGIALVLAIALGAFLCLLLFKFDRESCLTVLHRVAKGTRRSWAWALVAVAVLVELYGLQTLHQGTMQRLAQADKARYISAEDQGGGPTTQRAPSVSILQASESTQRIVIPSNTLNIINTNGVNALPGWSPEQARYGGPPALNVQDEVVKDDKTLVINRKTTVSRFAAIKLAGSDVDVRLRFKGRQLGQRRHFYQGEFSGRYTVTNPFPTAQRMHFSFPLPDNSGTLSGFHFKVNGQEQTMEDIANGIEYEQDLKGGEKATIDIAYTHLGAESWTYDVTGRREPIAAFQLQVHVDNSEVKFQRGSLYPSDIGTDSAHQTLLTWNLQNQITSQNINLYFPSMPVEQLVGNLYVFAPIGLVALLALSLAWASLRHTGLTPWMTLLATLVCCGGYALTSYLLSYMPLAAAIFIGFGLAAGLQVVSLGRRLWIPIVLMTAAPFTFLSAGDTGLLLSILSMSALAVTIVESLRQRDVVVS